MGNLTGTQPNLCPGAITRPPLEGRTVHGPNPRQGPGT